MNPLEDSLYAIRLIMADEGPELKYMPPPKRQIAQNYELPKDWEIQRDTQGGERVYGKSYRELLLDRLLSAPDTFDVMSDKLVNVMDSCTSPLFVMMSTKECKHSWIFTIKCQKPLRAITFLEETHRNNFFLTKLQIQNDKGEILLDINWRKEQEWSEDEELPISGETFTHYVSVAFSADFYSTFRQSIVFHFGTLPVLVKHLCVDVIPVNDVDKMKELKKGLVLSLSERWNKDNCTVVSYSPVFKEMTQAELETVSELLAAYPPPSPVTFTPTSETVVDSRPTRNNYRAMMHELLFVEEMAQFELVANFNIQTQLQIVENYLLSSSGAGGVSLKYAHKGELFALLLLGNNVSEDTSAGRLILANCTTVFISPAKLKNKEVLIPRTKPNNDQPPREEIQQGKDAKDKRTVYEALIEDKGKNSMYFRLSSATVKTLNLKAGTKVLFDVQFQLNRVPHCEWHQAIDKISDFRIIFPNAYVRPTIPSSLQWHSIDSPLNPKQREAVMAMAAPLDAKIPPILIIGPFGTGKTYTIAQGIKEVLKQPGTRILVCTHSNSAADLYIQEYLHPYVEAGHEEARPLRVYCQRQWVATVNHIVQKYAVIERNDHGMRAFKMPNLEEILKYRVIVVTFSVSARLSTVICRRGHFTHILLDEAAQAMECEAIMPLAFANDSTRIVLAGDYMQLGPELFSRFAKKRKLHISLLERLYYHYPKNFPAKILLCENYRAHKAIVQFTSERFYEQKIMSSGKQQQHEFFYPLTFCTAQGEDVQDQNSASFYNISETGRGKRMLQEMVKKTNESEQVHEVAKRVCELIKMWPDAWGQPDGQSIGIMTPYSDQVFRIRYELAKRSLGGIPVERVSNFQGKQFRAVFLSTVRTRKTSSAKSDMENDYGFLSDPKLLNTAITRAKSLVVVVGDPVSLCSVGNCRNIWRKFIQICEDNGSLFGITSSQIDYVEPNRIYSLNPLALEFMPRQYQEPSCIINHPILNGFDPRSRFPQHPQQITRFPQQLQQVEQITRSHQQPQQAREITRFPQQPQQINRFQQQLQQAQQITRFPQQPQQVEQITRSHQQPQQAREITRFPQQPQQINRFQQQLQQAQQITRFPQQPQQVEQITRSHQQPQQAREITRFPQQPQQINRFQQQLQQAQQITRFPQQPQQAHQVTRYPQQLQQALQITRFPLQPQQAQQIIKFPQQQQQAQPITILPQSMLYQIHDDQNFTIKNENHVAGSVAPALPLSPAQTQVMSRPPVVSPQLQQSQFVMSSPATLPLVQTPTKEEERKFAIEFLPNSVNIPRAIPSAGTSSVQVTPIRAESANRTCLENHPLFLSGFNTHVVSDGVARNGSLPLYKRQPGMYCSYEDTMKLENLKNEEPF